MWMAFVCQPESLCLKYSSSCSMYMVRTTPKLEVLGSLIVGRHSSCRVRSSSEHLNSNTAALCWDILQFWDYVLTLHCKSYLSRIFWPVIWSFIVEIRLVWFYKWSITTALFFLTRYLPLVNVYFMIRSKLYTYRFTIIILYPSIFSPSANKFRWMYSWLDDYHLWARCAYYRIPSCRHNYQ